MRSLTPVYVILALASAIVSVLLWRELRTEERALQAERQLTDSLRTQLAQARAGRVPSPQAQPAIEAAPRPAANVKPSIDLTALVAEAAKRQKTLLDNSDYHKARLAEVRATLKARNPLLARELGITEKQADAILDIMAERQLREDAQATDLVASGNPDAAAIAEMKRQQAAQQEQDKDTLTAMLGPARYEQLQDIQQTQIARTRINNLETLLTQSGQPLSDDQMLSLTKVVAAEQKREEKESQELRASGQFSQASQVDRAVEGDRRILDGASGILSAQQLETVRVRFEQRQAMERATGSVTSRERALGADSPD